MLDYGLAVIGVKKTGTPIPIWYPSRLIGTVAGIAMLYGVTLFAVNRVRRINRAAAHSTASDWLLLVLLWITGASGFLIEVALYLPPTPAWGYWVFLFHVAVAMELIILMPFTKFAHVIYRPVGAVLPRPRQERGRLTRCREQAVTVAAEKCADRRR